MNIQGTYREGPAVTIRTATWADAERLELLAELDEDVVPAAPQLLALVGDELWVALSLQSGAEIADPFRPSAEVAALVRERARQLKVPDQRRRGLGVWRARRAQLAPFMS
jgi:hypothetical protein